MGRKSTFTQEIADEILSRLEQGIPLEEICRTPGMPKSRTVHDWVQLRPDFAAHYARARADGYDVIAADCLKIADDASGDTIETENGPKLDTEFVARSKLRIETRLRLLRSWMPSKYGDKIQVEDATPKPQRSREQILVDLRESGLRLGDVFDTLTKPADTARPVIELADSADSPAPQSADAPGEDEDDLSGLET